MGAYGCLPDDPDDRDHRFAAGAPQARAALASYMPPAIDLRPWCPAPLNQGPLSSCIGHGTTEAMRYALINSARPDVELSRLALYYAARDMEGNAALDNGAQIRDAVKIAASRGVPLEAAWPYDLTKVYDAPPIAAWTDVIRVTDYQRVDAQPDAVKTALFTGHPVIIGVNLYADFEGDQVAATGIVPMPRTGQTITGRHCMLGVGYGQKPGFITVRNSWGPDWGIYGDCYIPDDYFVREGADFWVILTDA